MSCHRELQGRATIVFYLAHTVVMYNILYITLLQAAFKDLCRDKHTVVAAETAKFLVPLNKDTQEALNAKEIELAAQSGFKRIPGKRLLSSISRGDLHTFIIHCMPNYAYLNGYHWNRLSPQRPCRAAGGTSWTWRTTCSSLGKIKTTFAGRLRGR